MHTWTRRRGGFSYLELLLAGAIIGSALTAAGILMGTLARGQHTLAFQSQARCLAHSLLQEVLTRQYADPGGGSGFGLDADELASDRSTFDDVDDFHGYSESPPTLADGSAIDGFDDFGWVVKVEWVSMLSYPGGVVGSDNGLKHVVVTVMHDGVEVAHAEGFKAAPNQGQ